MSYRDVEWFAETELLILVSSAMTAMRQMETAAQVLVKVKILVPMEMVSAL